MPTRTFVMGADDRKRFWDVSWEGGEVEISSGKWGTNGRARSAVFTSVEARDAFIEREIRKVRKKGYEEIGAVAPAADAPSADIARSVERWQRRLDAQTRTAWRPRFVPGRVEGHGYVRSAMRLAPDDAWPTCASCGAPLSPILELDALRLPARHLRDDCLIQLFGCEAWSNESPESAACVLDGWLVRKAPREGELRAAPGASGSTPATLVAWESFEELPAAPETELLDDLDAEETEVLRSLVRKVGGALEAEDALGVHGAYAAAVGRSARSEHKLGGWPTFAQECTVAYEHPLFQLEEAAPFDVNFGGGAGHILLAANGAARFFWAC